MAKNKSQLKDRVASFRISRSKDNDIEEMLKDKPIAGCNCSNKFYRKLALDWMSGKLTYRQPEDYNVDPDVAAAMLASAPAAVSAR